MPKMSGMELLRSIRDRDLELPVILITAKPSMDAAREARLHGALNYLTKPVDSARLVHAVNRAERLHRLAIAKRMAMDLMGSTSLRSKRATSSASSSPCRARSRTCGWPTSPSSRPRTVLSTGTKRSCAAPSPRCRTPGPSSMRRRASAGFTTSAGGSASSPRCRCRPLPPAPFSSSTSTPPTPLADAALVDPESALVRVAKRVVLEITERAKLDVAAVGRRIAELREIGFRLAIDDLGAGYAGLTSFAWLEPEIVKLDMILVRDVDTRCPPRRRSSGRCAWL